jgi:hypothetical protein
MQNPGYKSRGFITLANPSKANRATPNQTMPDQSDLLFRVVLLRDC